MESWGSGSSDGTLAYAQRGRVDDALSLRGGYREEWTVFWLTAHFLNAAARLKELGVAIDR